MGWNETSRVHFLLEPPEGSPGPGFGPGFSWDVLVVPKVRCSPLKERGVKRAYVASTSGRGPGESLGTCLVHESGTLEDGVVDRDSPRPDRGGTLVERLRYPTHLLVVRPSPQCPVFLHPLGFSSVTRPRSGREEMSGYGLCHGVRCRYRSTR